MKYKQKDVCRLLNIKRETLRHYEKEGIIVPEIDPQNQYRYYDDYQVYLISECKRYQANEFSLSEIKEMLTKDSLHDYLQRMEKKQEDFEKKMDFYQKLSAFNEDYLMRLRMIPNMLNKPFQGYEEEILFVAEKENNQLILTQENISANTMFREELSFSFMMAYYPDYHKTDYQWGFGQRIKMGNSANGGIVLPASAAVMAIIDIGSEWIYSNSNADLLLSYAKENHLQPTGIFYMQQLVRTNEEDGAHRYMEAILPIIEADDSF